MRVFVVFCAIGLLCACGSSPEGSPVRVTLDDTQVIVGEAQTGILTLQGALGDLPIPLKDVGAVSPIEGGDLGASDGYVTVWLRNGTELRGRWADPELDVTIDIGGDHVSVGLQMSKMARFQTPGSTQWPTSDIFRVKTTHGDDLLVDPEQTRFTITNAMGTFSPLLSECRSVGPLGDPSGEWKIVLGTGTVLMGPLEDTAIALAMPLGPEEVRVPVETIVSMTWQNWGNYSNYSSFDVAAEEEAEWFQNGALSSAKRTH